MQKHTLIVLWINLCVIPENTYDIVSILEINIEFIILRTTKAEYSSVIEKQRPHLICLDFDYPNLQGLKLLRQIRRDHPSIPTIMLTKQHSENLAVWAFRTGVRDYFVKREDNHSITKALARLAPLALCLIENPHPPRQNLLVSPLIPNEFRNGSVPDKIMRTSPAVTYIETYFDSKITEQTIAAQCGMNAFVFSKHFHSEHGMTFREYLIRYRIERAKDLLCNPALTITEVAIMVGFNDASSFSRLFRRYVNQTPSMYRGQASKQAKG